MSYRRRSSNPNLRRRKSFKMNINGKERIIIPCTDVMETKSYFLGRKTYRWSGTKYSVISETLALGEVTGTACDG